MKTLLRWLGRLLLTVGVLALVVLLGVQGLRLAAKDDAHDAAIATMSQSATLPAGDNGFGDLALAPYDVAAADVPAELAAELERFDRWQQADSAGSDLWATEDGLESLPGYRAFDTLQDRARAPLENDDPLCPLRKPGCLAQVRADPESTRATLERHAGRLAAVQRSLAATRLDSPWPDDIATPLPDFRQWRLELTSIALQAVDGDTAGAAVRGCTLLAAMRRIDRQSRGIVQKLMAQHQAEGAAWLLLDLRQAGGTPLPADCAPARVALDADEASICEALRGEFRMHASLAQRIRASTAGWHPRLWLSRAYLVDPDLQLGWTARTMDGYCGDDAATLAARGELPAVPAVGIRRNDVLCYGAFLNCVLAEIGVGSYASYARDSLDHGARLRVLLAALDIADGKPRDAAVRDASITAYPVRHEPTRDELRVDTLRADETFVVPLSMQAPDAAIPTPAPAAPATPAG